VGLFLDGKKNVLKLIPDFVYYENNVFK
jgi:hypothetical protein